jgi:DNA primase
MARLIVPPAVRLVIVCADHDDPGIKAAKTLARRLLAEGRRAKILHPETPGADWADAMSQEVAHGR